MAITYRGTARTYPIYGNDATTQNLFVLTNPSTSRVDVYVRRLLVQVDPLVAYTGVMPLVKTSRATNVSGGIINDDTSFDTTANVTSVEIRTPLYEGIPVKATPGNIIWQQFCSRMHTAAEQVSSWDNNCLPLLVSDTGKEFVLHPGESIVTQVVGSAGTANAAIANNWFVECVFEEEPLATFAISGTVTLSGSGVTGAKVIVIEADDELMTNAHLVETITTPAGGAWSSTIRTGKVGAAFVQYKNGATYYTAPGSPFLS